MVFHTSKSELGRGLRLADAVAAVPLDPDDALVRAAVLLLDVVHEQGRLRHRRFIAGRRRRRRELCHANAGQLEDRPAVLQPREVKLGNCTGEDMSSRYSNRTQ